MLEDFRVARFRVVAQVCEEIRLPRYAGSALRGAFGHAFRRMCCSLPREECRKCLLREQCPYALVFEPAQSPGFPQIKRYKDLPPPYVIEPPETGSRLYAPGEEFSFHLILVGWVIELLVWFLVSFEEMGRWGLGKGQGRFQVVRVEVEDPLSGRSEFIYSGDDRMVRNVDLAVDFGHVQAAVEPLGSPGRVTLEFLTPTRLRKGSRLGDGFEFETLISRLLERISLLSIYYCGQEPGFNHLTLKKRAKGVVTLQKGLWLWRWERYSARQKRAMSFDGYLGWITYAGDLVGFLPLLKLGEIIHVGKNCTFGLGKYRMDIGE